MQPPPLPTKIFQLFDGKRVAIVDYCDTDCSNLFNTLRQDGCGVKRFDTAQDWLRAAGTLHWDAVIIGGDLNDMTLAATLSATMPMEDEEIDAWCSQLEGNDVMAELQEESGIPVICWASEDQDQAHLLKLGAEQVIPKLPGSIDLVVQGIGKLVNVAVPPPARNRKLLSVQAARNAGEHLYTPSPPSSPPAGRPIRKSAKISTSGENARRR